MSRTPKVPSYRRHKPTGQAIVVLGGKMFYLGATVDRVSARSTTGSSRSGLPREAVSPPASAGSSSASDMTVTELIRDYWRHVQATYVKDGEPTTEVCVSIRCSRSSRICTATSRRSSSARWP